MATPMAQTGTRRAPTRFADAHRAEAEAALEVLLDSAPRPDRRHGVHRPRRRLRGAQPTTAGSPSAATTTARTSGSRSTGRDPLADQSTDQVHARSPTSAPTRSPTARENAYPHAFDQIAQLFDAPAAPDLCVLHSAAHNWEDQGGHLGEHGSLGLVQARAPFVLAGKGVRKLGLVPQSARLVDVAPTICALLGCAPVGRRRHATSPSRTATSLDRPARPDERPRHVVGFLFDGTNSNVLYDMAARGEAPNVARLIEMGAALGHGALASLPTVTLANHTSIITGAHPGHHGILNNAWYDRAAGEQVITNSSATWPWSMQHLFPRRRDDPRRGAPHVARRVHRVGQRAVRHRRRLLDVRLLPARRGARRSRRTRSACPHTTERFVRPSKDYSWSSIVDHMGVDQALGIIGGSYRDTSYPTPALHVVQLHAHRRRDARRRSVLGDGGRVGARQRRPHRRDPRARSSRPGVFDDCAFALVADHGMEQNDPACRGDWDVALRAAGVEARDEAYGFLYFGVPSPLASASLPAGREIGHAQDRNRCRRRGHGARGVRRQQQQEVDASGGSSTTPPSERRARPERRPAARAATPISRPSPGKYAKSKIKVTYTTPDGTELVHVRPGRQRQDRVRERRRASIYSDGKSTVACDGTGPTAKCTDLGSLRGGAGARRHRCTTTFAASATLRSTSSRRRHKSSETIAGRDASCVTYKAADASASSRACAVVQGQRRQGFRLRPSDKRDDLLDKHTGFVRERSTATEEGSRPQDGSSTASDVDHRRRRSDPDCHPAGAADLPPGVTLPGVVIPRRSRRAQ